MKRNGFTLIEILVTVVIFSFASLSIILMISSTMHQNVKANELKNKTLLTGSMMEYLEKESQELYSDNSLGYDSMIDDFINNGAGVIIYAESLSPNNYVIGRIDSVTPSVTDANNYINFSIVYYYTSGDTSKTTYKISKYK
ncbi:prepilin-type N-terminal cleavage/methylation domain-containing protein [candidate division WOR-3 bacterium]|jgi:prepilin-type N-terminal cleavage/methylation domain-containing protein|nr:prepilin-type N-terminal cleavage/methylation domain-containing protein [candidate division WOR-3 bacterium]